MYVDIEKLNIFFLLDKSKSTPNQYAGKSTLTSLLTTNATTPAGPKTVIGTRRIIMTKGADGTTRVISQPISGTPKPTQSTDATPKAPSTPHKEGPQKVQIIRAPDGKLTVRGLLPGQQLIQMPDGKLHVVMAGQQGIAGQLVAASPSKPTETSTENNTLTPIKNVVEEARPAPSPRVAPQPPQIIVQGNRQILLQSQQQVVVQPPQQVVVQPQQQVRTIIFEVIHFFSS